jgi:hypothetical protein
MFHIRKSWVATKNLVLKRSKSISYTSVDKTHQNALGNFMLKCLVDTNRKVLVSNLFLTSLRFLN